MNITIFPSETLAEQKVATQSSLKFAEYHNLPHSEISKNMTLLEINKKPVMLVANGMLERALVKMQKSQVFKKVLNDAELVSDEEWQLKPVAEMPEIDGRLLGLVEIDYISWVFGGVEMEQAAKAAIILLADELVSKKVCKAIEASNELHSLFGNYQKIQHSLEVAA